MVEDFTMLLTQVLNIAPHTGYTSDGITMNQVYAMICSASNNFTVAKEFGITNDILSCEVSNVSCTPGVVWS